MAKKSAKKRKPNVFMQSYEVMKSDSSARATRAMSPRRQKLQSRHIRRSEIYVNTLPKELKRMGIITGGIVGALIVSTIVINLVT